MESKVLRRAEARLSDISSGGAAIVLDVRPPSQGPTWIGLEGTPLSEWMIADVVRVAPDEGSGWRAGLRFVRPCGPRFFKKAIWGFTPEEGGTSAGGLPRQDAASRSGLTVRSA